MIIWLASYPRSGNTALRILLHSAFDLPTYSIYDDPLDISANRSVRDASGHICHGLDPDTFVDNAASEEQTFLVKTHGPSSDGEKAIYVVRDGRSATVSYLHWMKRYVAASKVTLADVICGRVEFGSWSDHLRAWEPRSRPNTLFLRFEEVVAPTAQTIGKIEDFIGVKARAETQIPNFAELHEHEPGFFRAGSDERNIAELTGDDLDLFWFLHGETMIDFGYAGKIPETQPGWSASRMLLDEVQRTKTAQSELGDLRDLNVDLTAKLTSAQSELGDLRDLSGQLTAELSFALSKIDGLDQSIGALKAELEAARVSLDGRTAEADRLRRRLENLASSGFLRVGDKLRLTRALRKIRAELS